ncbi:unnamed protein product [Spirodela intermedia]|uniref:Uncharacterized protein n=1 Tax=Spirodela intermedia TaxID=51605 RepID=A0A7I8J7D9_SPIIN|nr:unnamed protein product [Spirodela intermedia]CAA6665984.1 unnamed protein product [Spirodela intermedia]
MGTLGVLLTYPMDSYLEEKLDKRFKLFRLWESPPEKRMEFLRSHSQAIRAVVGNAIVGADAETIEALPGLEIVASFKVQGEGIRVTNTPDVLTEDVADLAIGLAIAVLRKICVSDRYVRSGAWKTNGDFELTSKFSGKSVGIVGLGRIGLAIAKRAEAFGCPISYFARSEKLGVGYKFFPRVVDLAANCQVLVVACALTAETRHIVDREVIDALGPQGVLINIARGGHVDEAQLVPALREGRLGPSVPEELFALDNVVLLPHVGSGTWETRKDMADLVLGNLEAHALNMPLLTPCSDGWSR